MSVEMPIVKVENQMLVPILYEHKIYYVRFVRRGTRLDCSGVYKLRVDKSFRITPIFEYQKKTSVQIKKVIAEARCLVEK